MSTRAPNSTTLVALVDSWERFTALVGTADAMPMLGTAETVEALLARSSLADELDHTAEAPDAVLDRIRASDRRFKAAAPAILERTRVGLFRERHPADHWWWRVEELALGTESEVLLDVPEAARLKNVHPNTVRSAIQRSELQARRLGRGYLIQRRDLERWATRPVGRPHGTLGSDEPDALVDAFNAAMARRDFMRSHAIAGAMRAGPASARRCLAIGIDELNTGRPAAALRWVDQGLLAGLGPPAKETALVVRGLALVRTGQANLAVDVLKGLQAPPDMAWVADAARAEAFLATGRTVLAEHAVASALQATPDNAEARYLAARIAFHANKPWDALEHVLLYRHTEPDDPQGLVLHGSILGALGDQTNDPALYAKAAKLLRRAGPAGGAAGRSRYGVARARLGDWKGASRVSRSLVRSGHTDPGRSVAQAAVLSAWQHGGPVDARLAVTAMVDLFGISEFTRLHQGMLEASLGRVPETLAALGVRGQEIAAAEPRIRVIYATALAVAGNPTGALPLLQGAVTDPPLPGGALLLAMIAAGAAETASALDALGLVAKAPDETGLVAKIAVQLLRPYLTHREPADAVAGRLAASKERDAVIRVLSEAESASGTQTEPMWDIAHRSIPLVLERNLATIIH